MYVWRHASKYAELMHIRLSLRLSLVSYLCRYFTLLRFYHSTAFIFRILYYLSRRNPFDSYEPGLHPVNRFILSILSFRFLSEYYSRAFIASCTPTNYQLVRRITSCFPLFIVQANSCTLTLASCTQLCLSCKSAITHSMQ